VKALPTGPAIQSPVALNSPLSKRLKSAGFTVLTQKTTNISQATIGAITTTPPGHRARR